MIGSGIFRVPGAVAAEVGSVGGVAAVWVLGGIISLCGALSLAELAAAMPRSGGVFVYLQEIFGDGVAFLFGWTMLIIGPASVGALAIVFAEYFTTFVPGSPTFVRSLASLVVIAVSAGTYFSVRGVGGFVTVAAAGKTAALLMLVAGAFFLGDGGAGTFGQVVPHAATQWGGVGFALVSALWAYNGFNDMVSISGEVRNPGLRPAPCPPLGHGHRRLHLPVGECRCTCTCSPSRRSASRRWLRPTSCCGSSTTPTEPSRGHT